MPPTQIRPAGPGDEPRALAILALAFAADPFARWIVPDPAEHLATMPAGAHAFAGRAFAHGSAYMSEDGGGAALWLPPGVEPDAPALDAHLAATVPPERMSEIGEVFERMEAAHPHAPHWFLPLIGVDPIAQGRGIGDALMRHALARIDADGLPAYLDSSNPRNISLYRRHGFEPVTTIRVGTAPPVVPMLRAARRGSHGE